MSHPWLGGALNNLINLQLSLLIAEGFTLGDH